MTTPTRRDNETWLADLRSDGPVQAAALDDLRVLLHRGLHKGIGGRAGHDEAFLEDITQDALVMILQKIDQFGGRSQFTTWCVAIAVRLAISSLRRKHWKDVSISALVTDDRPSPIEPVAAAEPSVAADDEKGTLLAAMNTAIECDLTDKQRLALRAELKGMPMERIAEEMGSTRNAIYKLTHDARKKLKSCLLERGFDEARLLAAFD